VGGAGDPLGILSASFTSGQFPAGGFDLGWSLGPFDFSLGTVFGSPWGLPSGIGAIGGLPDWSVISEIQIPTLPRSAATGGTEDMAIDWGGLFGDVVGQAATSYFAPSPQLYPAPQVFSMPPPAQGPGYSGAVQRTTTVPATMENVCGLDGQAWGGQAPPKGYKVVNYCGQAVLRKIRRRRRRRMLSVSDKNDIASIISMAGKGQLAASLINRTSP